VRLTYEINNETLQELINIKKGLYYPLTGFMTSADYYNVLNNLRLSDNSIWTIPITFDVDHDTFSKSMYTDKLHLAYKGREIGYIELSDCFKVDAKSDVMRIFKTKDGNHPGVMRELKRFEYRIGGKITITDNSILEASLDPCKTRDIFKKRGWKTIVGFHTRNPVHRAHEYLHRIGLELCDGLFLNPIVGSRKAGDFSEEAIKASYNSIIENYYSKERVYFDVLNTYMRFAGPREAIFHAIIRRNLGCTHFIIGRDHAGVGNYYGKYEAQELAREMMDKGNLGIELLLIKEPYFCKKCDQIVTEKHCKHKENYIVRISGTKIRAIFNEGKKPDVRYMRPEVADAIIALKDKKFINST
jgi:sulfate adenylyltransferase